MFQAGYRCRWYLPVDVARRRVVDVFGLPAAMMAVFLTGNANGPPLAAVLMAGTALLMACVAGLISGTFLSSRDGTGAGDTGSTGHGGDVNVGDFGDGD
ncbi:hypothetical protein ACIQV3_36235 [Streptomyces sp. NPDC099050]|uniref:hypothetical protein n=1 Tax=Streptomyces sp. NPDC099050 TaxID=3366100 RepID=UPI003801DDB7